MIGCSRLAVTRGSCDAAPYTSSSPMGSSTGAENDQDGNNRRVELPEDVLDIIFEICMNRFELRDIIRSSITCKRWYSLAISKTASQPPWLMLQEKLPGHGSLWFIMTMEEEMGGDPPSGFNLYARFVSLWREGEDLLECRDMYQLQPRHPRSSETLPHCRSDWISLTSSEDGWMLYTCLCRYNSTSPTFPTLWRSRHPLWLDNPFSKVRISLPPYSPPLYGHYYGVDPSQCLVFFSPLFSCDFVVLISTPGYHLSLCKLHATQGSWLYYRNPRDGQYIYKHILFWKEEQLLCAIDEKLVVDVFMLAESSAGDVGLRLVKSVHLRLGIDRIDGCMRSGVHLVESCGEVLIVIAIVNDSKEEDDDVRVYKLYLSGSPKRMECLGGQALFLGLDCPAFSVAAKDFPQVKENSIYLADLTHVSVFTLTNGVITKTIYDPKYGFKCPKNFRMVRLIRPWVREINRTPKTDLINLRAAHFKRLVNRIGLTFGSINQTVNVVDDI